MMPRIRTVKPELFNHEGLFKAETTYHLPLRLAFIALFTCCDREGRFRWQPGRLKLALLPYDDVDITAVLDALVESGFIKKYECRDETYGCTPSWSRHQHVNHREAESELPAIEDVDPVETKKMSNINEVTLGTASAIDVCSTREPRMSDVARACPGGRERKGTEQIDRRVDDATAY